MFLSGVLDADQISLYNWLVGLSNRFDIYSRIDLQSPCLPKKPRKKLSPMDGDEPAAS